MRGGWVLSGGQMGSRGTSGWLGSFPGGKAGHGGEAVKLPGALLPLQSQHCPFLLKPMCPASKGSWHGLRAAVLALGTPAVGGMPQQGMPELS